MNSKTLLFLLSILSLSSYAQERPKGEPKQLEYTYSKGGHILSRLQKEVRYRKSSIFTEDTDEFLLYPNPADEFIIVDIADFEKPRQYKLMNNLGKVIKEGKLTNQITELHFSDLPKGVYYFTLIELTDETHSTQKIIKH